MYKFSVCVPVYEMKNGLGEKFLVEYLTRLTHQTLKEFEIIVSDQSDNNIFKNICEKFSNILDIKYITNNHGKKTAANNINNAMRHASGEIIKILYVDDFLIDNAALEKIYAAFTVNKGKWLISGFVVTDENRTKLYGARKPWYGNKVVNGDNVTGNPSNYSVRREYALEMDENLLWLVDGEYFFRSYYHYGDPILIEDILVCLSEHSDSAFHRPELRALDAKERQYCIEKYSSPVQYKPL